VAGVTGVASLTGSAAEAPADAVRRDRHRCHGLLCRSCRSCRSWHNTGLTLTELLVTLLVAAVLMAVAMPNFHALLVRQRLRAAANDLFAAIDLARSQAMTRGRRITLVPLDAGGDWARGWMVFADRNGNLLPDAGEEIIFKHEALADGIAVRYGFSATAGGAALGPYIAYNGAGRSCGAASSAASHFGSLSLTAETQVRHIKINMLGRARICDPQVEADCTGVADD
jgi:type IV fimbrial biogenesis protein FimT